jgi:methionine-gamma-lyase
VSPPIFQSSTYRWDEAAFGGEVTSAVEPTEFYARWGHPNQKQLEAIIAALEGAPRALAVGSGAAAALLSVLPFVSAGDHVVAAHTLYGETRNQLTALLPRLGITCTQVGSNRVEDFRSAIRSDTKVVVIETPANPTLEIVDISAVAEIARERGARLVVDNTFATPINTRPLDLGAHAVFHSATKYLSGHSDVIAGVLAGDEEGITKAWAHLRMMGPVLNPFDAWLVIRGLRTLPMRMAHHNENGLAIAHLLSEHPAIAHVYYPGLPTHTDYATAQRQMRGFGGMMAVELRGGEVAARTFVNSLSLFSMATSLGGLESLVQFPASLAPIIKANGETAIPGGSFVRLSVGCEDCSDLCDDVLQALSGV